MPSTDVVEVLYIFSNPLANDEIRAGMDLNFGRDMGLDVSNGDLRPVPGSAMPDSSNCIFAQQSRYLNSLTHAQSKFNGMADPLDFYYPLLSQTMTKVEQNTWGGMHTILGPDLHCYRFLFAETQNLAGLDPVNVIRAAAGDTFRRFSPISISINCIEENLTEGAYLIEASNAFNRNNANAPNPR